MTFADASQVAPLAASSPGRRVLLVTNETLAEANQVPEAIRPLVERAEKIYVVAPTLTTWMEWLSNEVDDARAVADKRLQTVFDHLLSEGLTAKGAVGAEDQVVAVADALATFDADLIVLRVHAHDTEHENWRERRVAEHLRSHFDIPTIVFYFDQDGHIVGRDEA